MRARINKTTGQPIRTLTDLYNKAIAVGLDKSEARHRVKMVSIKSEANLLFNN